MRIGLSCTTIEPVISRHQIDGIGTYTKHLYQAYLKNGKSVTPISFPKNGLKVSHYPNGQVFPFSYITSTLASIINTLPFSIHSNIEKKLDLFHATDHLIPQFKKTPVIATIHDAEMFKRHQWIKNRHLQHLKSWGRKKSLDWVSHFITISQAMIPELTQDCGIPEEKISVVYNGISSWWFEKVTAEVKNQTLAKLHLPEKFLLFVGTLNHRKNLPRLVKAYLALPSDIQQTYPLIVIGKAGWDSKESALAVQQLETKRAGRWLRYISDEDLRVLFQCASLYLHPSLHEGFGLTLLQSFASSTPVLTSNVAAMPEIADDAAYLVNPDSEEEIRAGMLKLLTSPSLCEDFIKKGDERVKQFSWEKTAKATLAVYDKIK